MSDLATSLSNLPRAGRRDRRRLAFSLVEVVLAIGVVGFALLVIIGTLPIGLKSVQNAETLQATSNIANQLRGQMQLLSFNTSSTGINTVQQLAQTNLFYTTDGIATNSSGGYYMVSFAVKPVSTTTNPVVDASFAASNVQSVVVNVAYPPGVWNQTNTFALLVARQTDN